MTLTLAPRCGATYLYAAYRKLDVNTREDLASVLKNDQRRTVTTGALRPVDEQGNSGRVLDQTRS